MGITVYSTSLLTLYFPLLLIFISLSGVIINHSGLICISLVTNDFKLLMYVLGSAGTGSGELIVYISSQLHG